MSSTLVWFRLDLRLADNPALAAAVRRGKPVIPIFIWSPDEEAPWAPGAASRWWLHQSLSALSGDLKSLRSRLIIRSGPAAAVIKELLVETGADTVFWNRRYEPAVIARDRVLKDDLKSRGITADSFNSALLFEPWTLKNLSGKPFQVFTPFWKKCLSIDEPPAPMPAPRKIPGPSYWPRGEALKSLRLEPVLDWAGGFQKCWSPGEAGAQRQLQKFGRNSLASYSLGRDVPAETGTSRLSPHLHFGEIGPRQVWHAVQKRSAEGCAAGLIKGAEVYLREIGWREFAYHLLYHFPKTPQEPLRPDFARFPWRTDAAGLRLWQKGQTGYPMVDAGMRELWGTGWMHNRVRMIAASFLVKDLLVSWQEGARWFWDTLVDADLASNTLGWQWVAGCGADAAPYYRVFNPALQAEKFDPKDTYIHRWVPEQGTPRSQYPAPCIDHATARDRALGAFFTLKKR